jgi:hypothetical protein
MRLGATLSVAQCGNRLRLCCGVILTLALRGRLRVAARQTKTVSCASCRNRNSKRVGETTGPIPSVIAQAPAMRIVPRCFYSKMSLESSVGAPLVPRASKPLRQRRVFPQKR